jgi:CRISPR/Cas system-associated endoribonuclease Cas2
MLRQRRHKLTRGMTARRGGIRGCFPACECRERPSAAASAAHTPTGSEAERLFSPLTVRKKPSSHYRVCSTSPTGCAQFWNLSGKRYPSSMLGAIMGERSLEQLRDELNRLMQEHIESVENETFTGRLNEEELRQQEERLKRIREISADYLAALKNHR